MAKKIRELSLHEQLVQSLKNLGLEGYVTETVASFIEDKLEESREAGYSAGYNDGRESGYDQGYDRGFSAGAYDGLSA